MEFAAAQEERANPEGSEGHVANTLRQYAEVTGTLGEAQRLGDNLAVWSRALQRVVRKMNCGRPDVAARSGETWRASPMISRRPLYEGGAKGRLISGAGGGSAHARVWKTLGRWLNDIARWSKRDGSRCTALAATLGHVELFLREDNDLANDALRHVEDTDRWQLLGECNLAVEAGRKRTDYNSEGAVKLLDRLVATATRRRVKQSAERFKAWVKNSLKEGGREAHRWTNAPNAMPPLRLAFKDATKGFITDPIEVAAEHRRPWVAEWETGHQCLWAREVQTLVRLRASVREGARDWADAIDLSPPAIRRACKSFDIGTAIGVDDLEFDVIARLPDNGLRVLGVLLYDIFSTLALPVQALLNILALLGKKSGGARTIAIMPTIYRLALRIAGGEIRDWDVKVAAPCDSALRGSSSLRAPLGSPLGVELAQSQGKCVLHFLWDLRKFYDSVRLEVLHERLESLGYNLHLLYLGFLAHKAPRVLKVGHCYSEVIAETGRSMIAGCQQSVSWARGLLVRFVEAVSNVVPRSPCGVHVDDLSHVVALDDHGASAVAKGLTIGMMVAEGIKELDLRLSDKSVLLPASSPTAQAVVKGLREAGVGIRAAAVGEDVGIAATAGTRRVASTLDARIARGKRRAERVGYLCKKVKGAAKLGKTGVRPQQEYGHQAMGASRSKSTA